jgi:hypothetical protein
MISIGNLPLLKDVLADALVLYARKNIEFIDAYNAYPAWYQFSQFHFSVDKL